MEYGLYLLLLLLLLILLLLFFAISLMFGDNHPTAQIVKTISPAVPAMGPTAC